MIGNEDDMWSAIQRIENRLAARDTQDGINTGVIQRVEIAVLKLVKDIGEESEDAYGKKIGTGVLGRLMRLEMKAGSVTQKWQGMAMAAAVFGVAAWWLLEDKLSAVLR